MGASFGTLVAVHLDDPADGVLPILFIVFGLGELSKVMLIIIGVAPCLIRDMSLEVAEPAARADDQGADAGRLDLAGGDPGGAAADHAAADRIACG